MLGLKILNISVTSFKFSSVSTDNFRFVKSLFILINFFLKRFEFRIKVVTCSLSNWDLINEFALAKQFKVKISKSKPSGYEN